MTVSPATAVFLNLYEEHLDHYGTIEKYYDAKKNIYLHQKKHDTLLINSEIAPENSPAYVYTISASDEKADIFVSEGKITRPGIVYDIPTNNVKLLGIHNHYNIAAAHFITTFYIDEKQFTEALCTFAPLSHRLEYVGTFKGIRWYDDSISTACATAVEAVKSVPEPATILIGGMDRGIDYTLLADFLGSIDINVICMETSGKRIFDMLTSSDKTKSPERIHYVPHLEEAVTLASEITPEGHSCVLSPASASYGIFKNFEERGDAFKALVNAL